MSLFKLFEAWYKRKAKVFKSPANKLATIRKWIACYFKMMQANRCAQS